MAASKTEAILAWGAILGVGVYIFAQVTGGLQANPELQSASEDREFRSAKKLISKIGGVRNAEYSREGYRPLGLHQGAFAGATKAEAQAIALGELPAKNTGEYLSPIHIAYDEKYGEAGMKIFVTDGRHRMKAASDAGATHILAKLRVYIDGESSDQVIKVKL